MSVVIISCPVCGEEYTEDKYELKSENDKLRQELNIMDKNFIEKSEKLIRVIEQRNKVIFDILDKFKDSEIDRYAYIEALDKEL